MKPGHKLSHYEILSQIGAGGMGEVYLARDLVLDRSVALKILPPNVAADADRLQRFVREAKAVSALSHSNIAQVYELGTEGGTHFIVMEHVAGSRLDARIGPTTPSEMLLDVAIQLADALDEAHSKGITHRDIKPANVLITPRGQVKVLDFGLAKIAAGPRDRTSQETTTEALTNPGSVMGTAQYMSPEQALGRELDHRTDIFSAGVMLYELATGVSPFAGDTPAAVFDAILHKTPASPETINPKLSPELARVVLKALEKEPDLRYQTASDLRADLKRLKRDSDLNVTGRMDAASSPRPPARAWRTIGLGVGLVLAAAVGAALFLSAPRRHSARPPLRPAPLTAQGGWEDAPALSPDGSLIAYTWSDESFSTPPALYVKQIGLGAPLKLTSDPAWHGTPAWSPDGKQLAFVQGPGPAESEGVYVMPALGGQKRRAGPPSRSGLDWSPDGGQLALSAGEDDGTRVGIFLAQVEGRGLRRLTTPPEGRQDGRPAFSPDGREMAFVRSDADQLVSDLFVVPLSGGEPRRLTQDQVPIQGLAWTSDSQDLVFDSQRSGTPRLWRVSARQAQPEGPELIGDVGEDALQPTLPRRGGPLAYCRGSSDANLWRVALSPHGAPTALLTSTQSEVDPQFSPDGKRLAFASNQTGAYEIWTAGADGAAAARLTSFGGPMVGTPRWSPDGRRIAFDARVGGAAAIYVMDVEGGRPQPISRGEADDVVPSWSRDGRRVYFSSLRSGRHEVFAMPPDGGARVQLTTNGGFAALESPDGRFLYYSRGSTDTSLWRLPLAGGGAAGPEENVVPGDRLLNWAGWAPTNFGVYYIEAVRTPGGPGGACQIRFVSMAAHRTVDVQRIDRPAWSGLTLAPDGSALVWSQLDHNSSQIMVAPGFR
jgi:Tol biopolymer transport system component